jgi:hypothetical protein
MAFRFDTHRYRLRLTLGRGSPPAADVYDEAAADVSAREQRECAVRFADSSEALARADLLRIGGISSVSPGIAALIRCLTRLLQASGLAWL